MTGVSLQCLAIHDAAGPDTVHTVTMSGGRRRLGQVLALGAAAGPAAFIGAWAIGGAITTRDYSPVNDTISRLAAHGAPTRALMTGGMIAFGLGVTASAVAFREALGGRAWIAVAATGISTLGVAATPLERSEFLDNAHLVAAGAGYITLGIVPLLAHRPLIDAGFSGLASFGVVMSTVSAVALPTSLVVSQSGLFQRIGLGAGDVFLIAATPVVRSLLRRR